MKEELEELKQQILNLMKLDCSCPFREIELQLLKERLYRLKENKRNDYRH